MKKIFATLACGIAVLCGSLAGCAGTQAYSRVIESGGGLRVAEPDNSSYDYKFYVKAFTDFGVDTSKQEDRLKLIAGYLKKSCSNVHIIGEQFLPAGGETVGEPNPGTYVEHVKCQKSP